MKRPVVPVSDHAVIRYLERVKGEDIEAVRREIRGKVALIHDHPTAIAINEDGWRYIFQEGVVTTIIKAHEPDNRTGGVLPDRRESGE
jgi:hypothetical protein